MSINKSRIIDCVIKCLLTHKFGEIVGDDVQVTDKTANLADFSAVNSYTTTEFKPVLLVRFHGYMGNPQGEGRAYYQLSYYSSSDNCHECFMYFAQEVANCMPMALTRVQTNDADCDPIYSATAEYTVPISRCAMS